MSLMFAYELNKQSLTEDQILPESFFDDLKKKYKEKLESKYIVHELKKCMTHMYPSSAEGQNFRFFEEHEGVISHVRFKDE